MRSKVAIWFCLDLLVACGIMPGCGASTAQPAGPIDARPAVDGSAEMAAPPSTEPNDAAPDAPLILGGSGGAGGVQPTADGAMDLPTSDGGLLAGDATAADGAAPPADAATEVRGIADGNVTGQPDAAATASDAGSAAADAPGASGDGAAGASSAYACTLMIGIQATDEWYSAGFETMVDNAKWELIWVHSGFVELWADAKDPVWSTAISSPCAQNPTKPDRVIFVALNFDYTTLTEWTPAITATVSNLEAKYPSAKRIELMSFIRAPGNNACAQAPAKRSTIAPAQDQAMAMAAAANPELVVVAPKFEAKTCGEFSSNPPHPSPAGVSAWIKMMADYYR